MTQQELYAEIAESLGECCREIRRHGFQPLLVENVAIPDEHPLVLDWDDVDRLRHRIFPE